MIKMISVQELQIIKFQLNSREQYQLQESRTKNCCIVANIAK